MQKAKLKWQCESRKCSCYATIYSYMNGVIVSPTLRVIEHRNNHPADPKKVLKLQEKLQSVSEKEKKTPEEFVQEFFKRQRDFKNESLMDSLSSVSSCSASAAGPLPRPRNSPTFAKQDQRNRSFERNPVCDSYGTPRSFQSLSALHAYENLTASALRSELKRRRLSISGSKSDLVERLKNSDIFISGSIANLEAMANVSLVSTLAVSVAPTLETSGKNTNTLPAIIFKVPKPVPPEANLHYLRPEKHRRTNCKRADDDAAVGLSAVCCRTGHVSCCWLKHTARRSFWRHRRQSTESFSR